jgi:hypothetical protein
MLGEKVGHFSGRTQIKALPAIEGKPRFETTAATAGTLAGTEAQCMATYWSEMSADGTVYAECPNSGVVMAVDGAATFKATGTGHLTEDGGAVFKGVAYFTSSAPSLSSLNGKAVVYDWVVDGEGVGTWDLWEWK